jgi:hypothetical protein
MYLSNGMRWVRIYDKKQLAKIDTKADKSVVDAMYTNTQIDELVQGAKDYADGKDGAIADVSDRVTTVENILNDVGEGEELTKGLVSRVVDLEAIDHDKLAADASAAAVATILDGAPEKFDTLKEIAAWIADADTAEDAASLVTRVTDLEAVADTFGDIITHNAAEFATNAENGAKALADENKKAIDAINDEDTGILAQAKDYADGKDGDIAAAKKAGDDAQKTIDDYAKAHEGDYTNEQVDAAVKAVADDLDEYAKAHEGDYTNEQIDAAIDADIKAVTDTFGDIVTHNVAEFATNAENGAKALADENKKAIEAINHEETGILAQAKGYADGLADDYATAEQGGKADTALQEVEVGTGLTVTAKDANKQKIEIDTNVVFVLDCNW